MTTEEKLKALILSRYQSLTSFSDACGVPYQTINSILKRGIKNAGISNIIDICKTLGLSVEDLYSGQFVAQNSNRAETRLEDVISVLQLQLDEGVVSFEGTILDESEVQIARTTLRYLTYSIRLGRKEK